MAEQSERLPVYWLERLHAKASASKEWLGRYKNNSKKPEASQIIALRKLLGSEDTDITFKYEKLDTFFHNNDLVFVSDQRFIAIVLEDFMYKLKIDQDETISELREIMQLIAKTDLEFNPDTEDEARDGLYAKLLFDIYSHATDIIEHEQAVIDKHEQRQKAKALVQRKFRIGSLYSTDAPEDRNETSGVYKCVQVVYTIGKNIVNGVVMEHVSGDKTVGKRKTLSVYDCRIYHIKYRKGLYMFNMEKTFYEMKTK